MRKPNALGFIFTLVFFTAVALVLFDTLGKALSNRHVTIISTLAPTGQSGYYMDLPGNIGIKIELFHYPDSSCYPTDVKTSGIVIASVNTSRNGQSCILQLESAGDILYETANVTVSLDHPMAVALGTNISISLPYVKTRNDDNNSVYWIHQLSFPPENRVLSGPSPSIIHVSLLDTYYEQLAWDHLFNNWFSVHTRESLLSTGYSGAVTTSILGSTQEIGANIAKNELRFEFKLFSAPNQYIVKETTTKTVLTYIAEVVPLFSTASAILALIVLTLETKVLKCLICCCNKVKARKKQAMGADDELKEQFLS